MFLIFTIIVHFVVRKIKPQDPHSSPTQPLSWEEGHSGALGLSLKLADGGARWDWPLQPAVPEFCRLPSGTILL